MLVCSEHICVHISILGHWKKEEEKNCKEGKTYTVTMLNAVLCLYVVHTDGHCLTDGQFRRLRLHWSSDCDALILAQVQLCLWQHFSLCLSQEEGLCYVLHVYGSCQSVEEGLCYMCMVDVTVCGGLCYMCMVHVSLWRKDCVTCVWFVSQFVEDCVTCVWFMSVCGGRTVLHAVSYTHLTLPTIDDV